MGGGGLLVYTVYSLRTRRHFQKNELVTSIYMALFLTNSVNHMNAQTNRYGSQKTNCFPFDIYRFR